MNLATKSKYKPDTRKIDEYHRRMKENWKKACEQSFIDRWPEYEKLNRIDRERIFRGE